MVSDKFKNLIKNRRKNNKKGEQKILKQENIDKLYNEKEEIERLKRELEKAKIDTEKQKLLLEQEKIGLLLQRNELMEEIKNGRKGTYQSEKEIGSSKSISLS